MDAAKVQEIIERHRGHNSPLMYILQDLQKEFNYLPKEALQQVSKALEIPMGRIYSVASFFHAFSLEPRGQYVCSVCMGTACHVRGAQRILDNLELELGVKAGCTSEDMKFTVETVNCVGACAIGPVLIVNDDYHGNLTAPRLTKILKPLREGVSESNNEEA
jgi:NADH-quinone oxidoreductase subunit E